MTPASNHGHLEGILDLLQMIVTFSHGITVNTTIWGKYFFQPPNTKQIQDYKICTPKEKRCPTQTLPKTTAQLASREVPIEYRPLMCESLDPNTREVSTISKGRWHGGKNRVV